MNYKFNTNIFILCIGFLSLTVSCIEESYFDCYKPIPIVITTESKSKSEVKAIGDARLYVFNEGERFIEWRKVDSTKIIQKDSIQLHYTRMNSIEVSAINTPKDTRLIYPEQPASPHAIKIKCNRVSDLQQVPDLYGGQQKCEIETGRGNSREQEVVLKRMVGQLKVVVNNWRKAHPDDGKEVYMKVERISSQVDLNLQGSEEVLSAHLPLQKQGSNSCYTCNPLTLFPSEANSGIVLTFCEGETPIIQIETDAFKNKLTIEPDQCLEVAIDFEELKVSVAVKPWENVNIQIEL